MNTCFGILQLERFFHVNHSIPKMPHSADDSNEMLNFIPIKQNERFPFLDLMNQNSF